MELYMDKEELNCLQEVCDLMTGPHVKILSYDEINPDLYEVRMACDSPVAMYYTGKAVQKTLKKF